MSERDGVWLYAITRDEIADAELAEVTGVAGEPVRIVEEIGLAHARVEIDDRDALAVDRELDLFLEVVGGHRVAAGQAAERLVVQRRLQARSGRRPGTCAPPTCRRACPSARRRRGASATPRAESCRSPTRPTRCDRQPRGG